MAKIIDCFLFFNEFDLLEIRLKYLWDVVDEFIIIEAGQTFMGEHKPYNFEDCKERYKRFLEKITYFKIEGFYNSFGDVTNYLGGNYLEDLTVSRKIANLLEKHSHYDKRKLYYVLDTYHRESIHIPLAKTARQDDIVIISDLDEIPSRAAISVYLKREINCISAFRQNEFSYYLNYYKNSDWIGSIIAPYSTIKELSFNELRIDSKANRRIVSKQIIQNGGYHFTTCGSIRQIKQKMAAWAHPEFNTKQNIEKLEQKIRTGQDPFGRSIGTIFEVVSLESTSLFDQFVKPILLDYPALLAPQDISNFAPSKLQMLFHRSLRLAKKIMVRLSGATFSKSNK